MLRSFLIYLSKAEWMRKNVMGWGIARRVSQRFVAGESLEQAIEVVKKLNQKGMVATLDQLGEDTNTPEIARQTAKEIMGILDAINEAQVQSGISLKLNQIGLGLDEALTTENLTAILKRAQQFNIFVRVDMEDSPVVDVTLRILDKMLNEYQFDNVGIVFQSCLYRSEQDTKAYLDKGIRIRMVKGAYKEPPEVAFPKKADVDRSFDELVAHMLDASLSESAPALSEDGIWPPIPAIATHDEGRIDFAKVYAEKINLPKEKLEFQMLYGIRRELQEDLVAEGYPVRVYVPFGTEWYPYFMRRLAERPANLIFFLGSLIRK